MANKFILEEVIKELVDPKASLVGPLMKLQYFASRIKNQDLLDYVKLEFNGYKGGDYAKLPEYRKTSATFLIDIDADGHLHRNLELPNLMLPDSIRDAFKTFMISEPVSILESYEAFNPEEHFLFLELPMDILPKLQEPAKKLYVFEAFRTTVVASRLQANRNIIKKALTQIRSELLSFCSKLEDDFGFEIEVESFKKESINNNQKIVNYMSNTIYNTGDGNVINTGDNAHITATITISKGDKDQLKNKLHELGVDAADIEELDRLLDSDIPDLKNKRLGEKTIDWVMKVGTKAMKGIGSITEGVTVELLSNYIWQYFQG